MLSIENDIIILIVGLNMQIYILIAILFLVNMKVNFAAILAFSFQIYSSVTFSPNPLCYHKKHHIIVNMFSSIIIITVNT